MKHSFSRVLSKLSLLSLCLASPAFGQGNDNPTGETGVFNGNSNTGCSYDPYTGNATRTIPDITVTGAVGAYPLVWAHTMNSRGGGGYFGAAGGWRHSYQWSCTAFNNPLRNTATSYTVSYPDGRVISFSGNPMVGPAGVRDRIGVSLSGDEVVLFLPDGGQVSFPQRVVQGGGEYEIFVDPPSQITDPNGQITTLSYDTADKLIQVTEPAGRWLKVYYNTDKTINRVDAGFSANPLTQRVTYVYGNRTFGTYTYNVLLNANYSDGTGAAYTYQASNVSASGIPLIKTCADVRYPGPMKNITYTFLAGASQGRLYQSSARGAQPRFSPSRSIAVSARKPAATGPAAPGPTVPRPPRISSRLTPISSGTRPRWATIPTAS